MYDHNKKAGNPGDVVKHPAVIAAARALMDECDSPFSYADTFAGYPHNPLRSDGEWRSGIDAVASPDCIFKNDDVKFWHKLWFCGPGLLGSVYPGSSMFVFKLCLSKGRSFHGRLWDTSPSVVSQLMRTYHHGDETVIYPRPAKLEDFSSAPPHLLLIDPPGLRTTSKKGYPDLMDLLPFLRAVPNGILWFPITAQGNGSPATETEESKGHESSCIDRELSITSVRWTSDNGTCGCRLAYKLPDIAANRLRNAVDTVAEVMGWGSDSVTHDH